MFGLTKDREAFLIVVVIFFFCRARVFAKYAEVAIVNNGEYQDLARDQQRLEAQYSLGWHLLTQNDSRGMVLIQLAADGGIADAQVCLGYSYNIGFEFGPNKTAALYYYKLAADQSNPVALYNLGNHYKDGDGVTANRSLSFDYYSQSANLGYPEAQFKVAEAYRELGNTSEVKKYLKLAASGGLPQAYHKLAVSYFTELLTNNPSEEAVKYVKGSADFGDLYSQLQFVNYLERVSKNESETWKYKHLAAYNRQSPSLTKANLRMRHELNGDIVSANKTLAFAYHRTAAGLGIVQSQHIIAEILENEDIESYFESKKYFEMAAKGGHAVAQLKVGADLDRPVMNIHKRKATIDKKPALKYYHMAAEQGVATAMYIIATTYREGTDVEKNYSMALEYFKKAAELNHAQSLCALGEMYEKGEGVPQNLSESMKYFQLAADRDCEVAFVRLGIMYWNGQGVDSNKSEACRYFVLAAEANLEYGQYLASNCFGNGHPAKLRYLQLASNQGNKEAKKQLDFIANVEAIRSICSLISLLVLSAGLLFGVGRWLVLTCSRLFSDAWKRIPRVRLMLVEERVLPTAQAIGSETEPLLAYALPTIAEEDVHGVSVYSSENRSEIRVPDSFTPPTGDIARRRLEAYATLPMHDTLVRTGMSDTMSSRSDLD